jgi:hypothetical protein
MPDIVDSEFGPLELREGTWHGTVHVPALGGDIPVEFDGFDDSPPSDKQRHCLSDFLSRCDEAFVRRIEQAIFETAQMFLREQDMFGRQKAALDKIVEPADVWQTLDDLSIMVYVTDEHLQTLGLQWSCQWEDEHGLEVLYQDGGLIKVTEIGYGYFE